MVIPDRRRRAASVLVKRFGYPSVGHAEWLVSTIPLNDARHGPKAKLM
jgi:hypothetical protein